MYRGLGGSRPTQRTELVGPLDQPGEALAQLQAEPGRVIGTLTREYVDNFAAQFLTQPYGGFDLVFLRKGSDYYYGMWFYAYVLTIAGTIIVIGGLRAGGIFASGAVLILGLIVSRTIPHLILASDYRHRAPLEPFLILLASVAAARFAAQALTSAQPDVANSTSLGSRGR